jgi:hypothetical protein
VATAGKAKPIKGASSRRNATDTLQRGNQGVDFAPGFKATQGADGALAGFALLVTEGFDQLGVTAITGLGDLDEHGAECSANWKTKKLLKQNNVPLQSPFALNLKIEVSP